MGIQAIARQDYVHSSEASHLSFHTGDTIIVVNILENGWCDGICSQRRGWFPLSYIDIPGFQGQASKKSRICSDQDSLNDSRSSLDFPPLPEDDSATKSPPAKDNNPVHQTILQPLLRNTLEYVTLIRKSVYFGRTQVLSEALDVIRTGALTILVRLGSLLDDHSPFTKELVYIFSMLETLVTLSRRRNLYKSSCIQFTQLLKTLACLFVDYIKREEKEPSSETSKEAKDVCFLPSSQSLVSPPFHQLQDKSLPLCTTTYVAILSLTHHAYTFLSTSHFWQQNNTKQLDLLFQHISEGKRSATEYLDTVFDNFTNILQSLKRVHSAFQKVDYAAFDVSVPSITIHQIFGSLDNYSTKISDLFMTAIELEQAFDDVIYKNRSIRTLTPYLLLIETNFQDVKDILLHLTERFLFLSLEHRYLTQFIPGLESVESKQIELMDMDDITWYDSKGLVHYLLKQSTIEPKSIRNWLFLYWSNTTSYNDDGKVKFASLTSILNNIVRVDIDNTLFIRTFLSTHASIISSGDLFSILSSHYLFLGQSQSFSGRVDATLIKRGRKKIVDVMLTWLESYFIEELENVHTILFLTNAYLFCEEFMVPTFSPSLELLQHISNMLKHPSTKLVRSLTNGLEMQDPEDNTAISCPLDSMNVKDDSLFLFPPDEIAKQLCLIEFHTFSNITAVHFLTKIWSNLKNIATNESSTVCYISNQLVNFVAETIVRERDLRKRTHFLSFFIQVSHCLFKYNNFASLFSIISALNSAPVHRLKRTWSNLSNKYSILFDSLNSLTDTSKNFSQYRECLERCSLPCVPFLGVYFTDLTFLKSGNKDTNKNLINFDKRMKAAKILDEVQQFQAVPYKFDATNDLQELLHEVVSKERDSNFIYNESLLSEPRESEDQTLRRLLVDSGIF
ncbi:guanyl-nucleotide exchange factor Ste6 [Schizosaccharomyces cryophilus OY26]|uniref:Guanyl-nucleotide exchange factor Ste6 n=1 Tax=Schizosaccharomyces cryophilus (strain OY26 / ATCC MYA-4695 / CBS 11777 / NBRC 106824 / NRRL Y48691) TaxID=653667 RepID=S9VWJ2_SCHCR|nr:guanyl-nucleotide exchange factor Ste6 [Schizosaccharomyces cryophilus OY26]EPY52023.1 guanyl-nucleotide exchange factor Ste6 [Schizosaccharomyces cryophilus OY26]